MRLSELPGGDLLRLDEALEHLPADYTVKILRQQIQFGYLIPCVIAALPPFVMVSDLRDFIGARKVFDRPAPVGPFVYFIQERGTHSIKVGTAKDPIARMGELQIGNPHELVLLGIIPGGRKTERHYHAEFSKSLRRGEWYAPDPLVTALIANALACDKRHGFLHAAIDPVAMAHAPFEYRSSIPADKP